MGDGAGGDMQFGGGMLETAVAGGGLEGADGGQGWQAMLHEAQNDWGSSARILVCEKDRKDIDCTNPQFRLPWSFSCRIAWPSS
ncbi:hypothetical protein NCCP691_09080 [Noviherbaspirillum aridicola]|uniref:Uncharacterized protein n=1 Tax=Noviherbaspirillum aridicola TaxID=2849687 RepID=A0ABQ4Q1B0_9BURK|nr:hypothetical protein NCCP691_09080 [Noviherbaspirillum aridicola]